VTKEPVIGAKFNRLEIAVIQGGPDTAKNFVELPFDYLLFTGSTAIGREVAKSAAGNLVPVTLELGGKSPAIIDPSADLAIAIPRIVNAKLFNAGQTCIAPDYLLVERGHEQAIANALLTAAKGQYPTGAASPDMTAIINDRHFARLKALLEDAKAKGARVLEMETGASHSQDRRMGLTILLNVTADMQVMQEEIFGPILPVVSVADTAEANAYVNARPRPLALYWFGEHAKTREKVLRVTISGGVTINDCMWHFGQEAAPFGGVGASGYGAYHGEHGFRTFSHERTVFYQSRWTLTRLFRPPYGARFDRMMRVMRRL
jgi:coniferyl-aldehyde dehydrogenase